VRCLAEAVYYEAGFEPPPGQRAVAQVVVNRVRDRNFPASVCGVVYQGQRRKTGCQFSFACDGSRVRRPPALAQWNEARIVAQQALGGYVMAAVGTATHYHVASLNPWWEPTVIRVAQVGAHVFYRWPGRAGLPSALTNRYDGREHELGIAEAR
jgi:spore germination cell wall hydrolase CwlJ-like protein